MQVLGYLMTIYQPRIVFLKEQAANYFVQTPDSIPGVYLFETHKTKFKQLNYLEHAGKNS